MERRRSSTPRVSVVVPTRNEAKNLEVVLPAIAAVRPPVHEIIVVDGNSVDGTVETARRVLPWARVITQTRKGKGNAMACGFAAVTGDVIVMFDADGSADPAEIPAFVSALICGADFAKGSRFVSGGGSEDITLLRKTGNAGLNGVANALFRTRHSDLCYGYNAFWADLLPVLELPDIHTPPPADGSMVWGDGFEIETVLNCRVAAAGLKVTEVPSMERPRIHGDSNLRTFSDGARVLRTLVTERGRVVRSKLDALAAGQLGADRTPTVSVPAPDAGDQTPTGPIPHERPTPARRAPEHNGFEHNGIERNGADRNGAVHNGAVQNGTERIAPERVARERTVPEHIAPERIVADAASRVPVGEGLFDATPANGFPVVMPTPQVLQAPRSPVDAHRNGVDSHRNGVEPAGGGNRNGASVRVAFGDEAS